MTIAGKFEGGDMARAYYSRILDNDIEQVWSIIRDFNDDRWSGDVTESKSENDKSGSTVGTIRFHKFGDNVARSDLQAYSEIDHYFTYGFVGTPPLPIENYQSTLRLVPVTEGDKTFVEWSATFDCAEAQRDELCKSLGKSYGRWLRALEAQLR